MHTLMVLYGTPEDPDAFRIHFRDIHLDLVRRLPGVRATRYSLDLVSPQGVPLFAAVFEADFDSAEDMARALASPEGVAAQSDTQAFATGVVQILHFEIDVVETD